MDPLAGNNEELLPVPDELLREMGWSRFVALLDARTDLVSPVLKELRGESCVHSWHTLLAQWKGDDEASLVDALLQAAKEQRPTTVFTYAGCRSDGTFEVVGIAAVSDQIRHGFQHAGFPVIARAFLLREHRGKGLYPYMVQHRLDFCESRWGDELRAVHLGSADPAVWATVSNNAHLSLPFLYIGDEDLEVVGSHHEVRDFLAFAPPYLARVRQALANLASGNDSEIGEVVVRNCQSFLSGGADAIRYPQVREALQGVLRERDTLADADRADLQALLELCDALPVVR
jgi:GNAT superfamily N-acetyltransferase